VAIMGNQGFLGIGQKYSVYGKGRFVVIPVPFEKTTSYKKGTRFGPSAIINASHEVELFDEELCLETYKSGIHTLPPLNCQTFRQLRVLLRQTAKFVSDGKFVIVIGGEHSITPFVVENLSNLGQLSILHFDAHADLREKYGGSKYSHASAMRRVLDFQNVNIVQVGIRSISEDEYPLVNHGRVRTFLMHKYVDIDVLIPQVINAIYRDVYITIDLDGFDPSCMPSVGTPVPGGFFWCEALDLLREVIYKRNVVSCDVVELCPIPNYISPEFTAAKLIYRIMGYVVKKDTTRPKPPQVK